MSVSNTGWGVRRYGGKVAGTPVAYQAARERVRLRQPSKWRLGEHGQVLTPLAQVSDEIPGLLRRAIGTGWALRHRHWIAGHARGNREGKFLHRFGRKGKDGHRAGGMATFLGRRLGFAWGGVLMISLAVCPVLVVDLRGVYLRSGSMAGRQGYAMPRRAREAKGDHRNQQAAEHEAEQTSHGILPLGIKAPTTALGICSPHGPMPRHPGIKSRLTLPSWEGAGCSYHPFETEM